MDGPEREHLNPFGKMRRMVLGGGAALVAAGVANKLLPKNPLNALTDAENAATSLVMGRAWLETGHKKTRERLRSKEGQDVLANGDDTKLAELILSLSGTNGEAVTGAHDPASRFKTFPSLLMSGQHAGYFKTKESLAGPDGKVRKRNMAGWGNAFRLGRGDCVLTNDHVAKSGIVNITSLKDSTVGTLYSGARSSIDAALVQVDNEQMKIIENAPVLSLTTKDNPELLGEKLTLTVIDTDEASRDDGTKRFASLMVPVTPNLLEFIKKHSVEQKRGEVAESLWRTIAKSHMVLLHSGSWVYMRNNEHIENAPGISGSPGFLDDGTVGGIVHAGLLLDINGAKVGVGFVNTASDVLTDMSPEVRARAQVS